MSTVRRIGFFARGFPGRVRRREKPSQTSDLESISYTNADKAASLATVSPRNTTSTASEEPSHTDTTAAVGRDASGSDRATSQDGASSSQQAGASPSSDPGNLIAENRGEQPVITTVRSMSNTRVTKFQKCLSDQVVDLEQLRELAWSGIPPDLRPVTWKLLLGYLPPSRSRRDQILARKRKEYRDMVPEYYDVSSNDRTSEEAGALRQVAVDVPRTAPGVAFFHMAQIQKLLERILYIWGIRGGG